MTNQPIYIFDLDGTLADCQHRLHHILKDDKSEKDWDAFYEDCDGDAPIQSTIDVLNALAASGAHIKIITGRSDAVTKKTVEWFWRHNVQVHEMRMRQHGDHTEDHELKLKWFEQMSPDERSRVKAVFEDRSRVVQMWRDLGLTCYQVASGEF